MLKVIVPLDGSRLAETALELLARLRPLDIESVTLVAVVESAWEDFEAKVADEYVERQRALLSAYLEGVQRRLEPLGMPIHTTVRCGRPDAEILQVAREEEAGLILMTTHGRSGIGRWLIGSVADVVLRTSAVPVLLIGPKALAAAEREPRNILVPLDGSELAERALAVAAKWAAALKAKVHLVRAVNLVPLLSYDIESAANAPALIEAVRSGAAAYLEEVSRRQGLQGAAKAVRLGATAEQLTEYEDENAVDLVVMTSHGRGGAARALLGSTTGRLLQGHAPVLVVPVREGAVGT